MSRAAVLTAAYYGVIFGALGAHLPYWPVWLQSWGLSEAEVGRYLGLAIIARIIGATLVPAMADRYAIRRGIIAVSAALTVAVYLGHLLITDKGVLLAATAMAAVVLAPSIPLGEALGIRAAARHGFAYAPVRAVGSAAFLAMNVAIGALIGQLGPDLVLWVVVIGYLGVAGLGLIHPGGGAGAATDRAGPGEAAGLLRHPAFVVFAMTVAVGHAGHGVYYVYSVLDWRAQGIADAWIGWLWAVGVLAETALMLGPGRRWVARLGPARALGLAALAGIVRWSWMAWSPAALWLWPIQCLHALTFALGHLGAMAFIASAIPGRLAASAQGVISGAIGGVVMALAAMVAAMIVEARDIASAYWLAAGLATLSLIGAAMLARLWSGEALASET